MCRVLSVKPLSYYDWTSHDIREQQIHHNHCELLAKSAHSETEERYGYERLYAKLTEQGHDISLYMIRSIKEEHNIQYRRHKRFKITTDSNHNKLVYPNVLDQQFDDTRPNKYWMSDITISGQMRVGCTWQALKTYTLKSWSAMPSTNV